MPDTTTSEAATSEAADTVAVQLPAELAQVLPDVLCSALDGPEHDHAFDLLQALGYEIYRNTRPPRRPWYTIEPA